MVPSVFGGGGVNIIGHGGGRVQGGQMVKVRWPWDRDGAGEVTASSAKGGTRRRCEVLGGTWRWAVIRHQ